MFLGSSPFLETPPLPIQDFSTTVLLYNSDSFASFSKSRLDITTYFNLWGPILYLKVGLSILAVIGRTNSASSGSHLSSDKLQVHHVQRSEVAAVPPTSWQARQYWRDPWESGTYLWVILETFGQSVGFSLALIAKLPHSFWYLDLPPLLVCYVELSKLAGVFCWTE